ncbi:CASP-like protein 1B1 [Ziziphus jujuba]|uniref:CASP-like protein n=1 Tax=Ziziphus jujuba TaxID=326968 RepID=A0A6P3ZQ37_ZIZJJ|nr:CASP-like protein 1B1 [Ziziphus jujuba]
MAMEIGGKAVEKPIKDWRLLFLRMVSFLGTASATLVMAFSKETKTLVVATIGNTPISATITAKFQHNPAFVFFVIANAMASLHNLLMIMAEVLRDKFNDKGVYLVMVAILDMMTVGLASAGDGGATFMAMLGKKGNSHARWNKICDKFDRFCDRGGGALIASYVGLAFLLLITVLSIIKLLKHPKTTNTTFP